MDKEQIVICDNKNCDSTDIIEFIGKSKRQCQLCGHLWNLNTPNKGLSYDDKLLQSFTYLLEKQFRINHSVGKYAYELRITQKKLSALSKKRFGLTPLYVIHHRIFIEAKRLLADGNLSHKEISCYLGFDSPPTFSQFIKKKSGLSPTQLRNDIQPQEESKPDKIIEYNNGDKLFDIKFSESFVYEHSKDKYVTDNFPSRFRFATDKDQP